MYQTYNPNYNTDYSDSSYYNQNPQDDRFVGLLGPFLLGGLTGGLVASGFNRPCCYPPYPYPPYPVYPTYPPYAAYPPYARPY